MGIHDNFCIEQEGKV